MNLDRIPPQRKAGSEPLHADGVSLGTSLQEFWQWAGSDLMSNAQRGVLAEFLVARALGVDSGVRTEWDAYDVLSATGLKVEVKASGFVQVWEQKALSKISFDIALKRSWDSVSNQHSTEPSRPADVYVFALHAHTDQASIDPLNVTQWEFYVLGTALLDHELPRQKQLGLATLRRLCPEAVPFERLAHAVEAASSG